MKSHTAVANPGTSHRGIKLLFKAHNGKAWKNMVSDDRLQFTVGSVWGNTLGISHFYNKTMPNRK